MLSSVPLFVLATDVFMRMQLDPSQAGIEDVVNSAIRGAQTKVQSVIGFKLPLAQQDCRVFLDSDAFSGIQPDGFFRVEMPSGFVRQDSPIVVTFFRAWNAVDAQTADPATYQVDYERGYFLFPNVLYRDCYVRIQCTTGFNPSVATPVYTSTPGSYDPAHTYAVGDTINIGGAIYLCVAPVTGQLPPAAQWVEVQFGPEELPDDLYEAILNIVPAVFDSSQVTNRDPGASKQYKDREEYGVQLLSKYIRLKGFSFRP